MKIFNAIEYCWLSAGIVLAIADVQAILSIILLIVDSIWLLLKLVLKIFKLAKDGELSDEDLEEIEEEINKYERKDN